MLELGLSVSDIGRRLQINRRKVYRLLQRHGFERRRFSDVSRVDLERFVLEIKSSHPNIGESMLAGHLRARGIRVPRHRLRTMLHHVDHAGVALRRSSAISRREYLVPCPNYIWHMDGLHKLIRWKFVIHGCVDGYSRLIIFMRCSTNNKASTMCSLFDSACQQYGIPLRVRTDYGGENVQVWDRMITTSGTNASVVVGSSVHNERIERMWRDINRLVTSTFKEMFFQLEADGDLDPLNASDLKCLHVVYLPLINRILQEHVGAHNNHSLSSEGNFTPYQLYDSNQHLLELHRQAWNQSRPTTGGLDRSPASLQRDQLPHVQVDDLDIDVPHPIRQQIQAIVHPATLTISNARARYHGVSRRIGQYIAEVSRRS